MALPRHYCSQVTFLNNETRPGEHNNNTYLLRYLIISVDNSKKDKKAHDIIASRELEMSFEALWFGHHGRCQSRFWCRSGVLNSIRPCHRSIMPSCWLPDSDRQIDRHSWETLFLFPSFLSRKPSVQKPFKQVTAHVTDGWLLPRQLSMYIVHYYQRQGHQPARTLSHLLNQQSARYRRSWKKEEEAMVFAVRRTWYHVASSGYASRFVPLSGVSDESTTFEFIRYCQLCRGTPLKRRYQSIPFDFSRFHLDGLQSSPEQTQVVSLRR